MSTTVTAQISVKTSAIQTNPTANGTYTGSPAINYSSALGTNNISQVYTAQRTISGTSETLDVTSGLTDPFGQTINLTTLSLLHIVNDSGTDTLTIGGGTHPAFGSNQYTVAPGKCFYCDSAFTIDSTHKVIAVSSTGSGTQYSIIILGS